MATLTINFTPDETNAYHGCAYTMRDFTEAAKNVGGIALGIVGDTNAPTGVTLIGSTDAINQVFHYFYTNPDSVLSAAENIEYRKYHKIIADAAEGISQQIAGGDFEDEDDDALTKAIDSAAEVIYYSEASLTLRHSNNADAYENETGEKGGDDCVRATYAQYADIREELGDLDDLFARLAPLSDHEKERAEEYVRDGLAGDLEEQYGSDELHLLIADAAVDVRDTDAGQEKVIAYLRETFPDTN